MLAVLYVAAVLTRHAAARPERLWVLAVMPVAALLLGRRTRGVLVVVAAELAALWLAQALVTLLRAARLEGG